MVCPGDEPEQYGRMLLLEDLSFAGFTSTRTHFESSVLGSTTKQNCSHLCHLCFFHLSTTQASQLIQENHKIVPHFSPFHLSLSLMAMSLTQLSIFSNAIYLLPVFSHEGATRGSIFFHSLFSLWYYSPAPACSFMNMGQDPFSKFPG